MWAQPARNFPKQLGPASGSNFVCMPDPTFEDRETTIIFFGPQANKIVVVWLVRVACKIF